ncbi:MAG: hypothetical protein Q7T21_02835 [Gallionella sp.]|nr:hypothetical protein [Gallionella sp.]
MKLRSLALGVLLWCWIGHAMAVDVNMGIWQLNTQASSACEAGKLAGVCIPYAAQNTYCWDEGDGNYYCYYYGACPSGQVYDGVGHCGAPGSGPPPVVALVCIPAGRTVDPCPSGYAPNQINIESATSIDAYSSAYEKLPLQDIAFAIGITLSGLLGILTGVKLT